MENMHKLILVQCHISLHPENVRKPKFLYKKSTIKKLRRNFQLYLILRPNFGRPSARNNTSVELVGMAECCSFSGSSFPNELSLLDIDESESSLFLCLQYCMHFHFHKWSLSSRRYPETQKKIWKKDLK